MGFHGARGMSAGIGASIRLLEMDMGDDTTTELHTESESLAVVVAQSLEDRRVIQDYEV